MDNWLKPSFHRGCAIIICLPAANTHWPLTCCSKLRITATAWWRTSSLVCGFSLFRCSWHMWPSSLKASLMSRTRRRSRELLAILLSRSRSAFCSGLRSSSSRMLRHEQRKPTGKGVAESFKNEDSSNSNRHSRRSREKRSERDCFQNIFRVFLPSAGRCARITWSSLQGSSQIL